MQHTLKNIRFALESVVALCLIGWLGQPLSAETLPYHGTASNSAILWWITQTGLGGAAEFQITNSSNSNAAVLATSTGKGAGVYAYSAAGNGIYAYTDSAIWCGMWGYSSSSGIGVEGQSATGYGMFGYTAKGNIGIYGKSDLGSYFIGEIFYPGGIGVYGENTQTQGTGVSGQALGQGGTGMSGTGASYGVYGSSANGTGVLGSDTSGVSPGVEGDNRGPSNSGVGVLGSSNNGYGVRAYGGWTGLYTHNNAVNGQDVYLSTRNLAGDFFGEVDVHGNIYASGYKNLSDARYKKNVRGLPHALNTVLRLRGVSFDWRRNAFPRMQLDKTRQIGFLAQEVEKVVPELVSKDGQGVRSVAYVQVVPLLVEAIKQQQRQIESLQAQNKQLAMLQRQFAALTARLTDLQHAQGATTARYIVASSQHVARK